MIHPPMEMPDNLYLFANKTFKLPEIIQAMENE
jgi:hypothetical protein